MGILRKRSSGGTENRDFTHHPRLLSDIFLPAWFAERIPILFSPPFAIGLAAIGTHRARRQPTVAALSIVAAALFLIIPWFYQRKAER
jgi:hypothetical protein